MDCAASYKLTKKNIRLNVMGEYLNGAIHEFVLILSYAFLGRMEEDDNERLFSTLFFCIKEFFFRNFTKHLFVMFIYYMLYAYERKFLSI